MSRKRIIGSIILLVVAGGSFYAYKQYSRKNKDLSNVKADIKLTAATLIREYEASDSVSNEKYLGKILEVTGNLRNVEKDGSAYYTVVLGDTTNMSSIRCSMDTTHQQDAAGLEPNSSIVVRGACTGFIRDELGLGSDIILNRCVIIPKKN